MKKSIRGLAMLGVCALSLASCTSKVTFADFQTKANEALKKECDFTKGEVTGTVSSKSSDNKSESKIKADIKVTKKVISPASVTGNNGNDAIYGVFLNLYTLATYTVAEDSNLTYYAGGSFKVTYTQEDEDKNKVSASIEWNEYGLVTAIKGVGKDSNSKSTYDLKVTYSK